MAVLDTTHVRFFPYDRTPDAQAPSAEVVAQLQKLEALGDDHALELFRAAVADDSARLPGRRPATPDA